MILIISVTSNFYESGGKWFEFESLKNLLLILSENKLIVQSDVVINHPLCVEKKGLYTVNIIL